MTASFGSLAAVCVVGRDGVALSFEIGDLTLQLFAGVGIVPFAPALGLVSRAGSLRPYVELLARPFERDTFVYCDPPYLQTAVLSRLRYEHVLTPADHRRLLRLLKAQHCPVMVSGYWSRMYAEELVGWRAIQFGSMTRGGYECQEWLWMNYPDPHLNGRLHDYRYVGENFREREKFRRQQRRWNARLAKMTPLHRMALMSALERTEAPNPRKDAR